MDGTGLMPGCYGKAQAGRTDDKITFIWFNGVNWAMEKILPATFSTIKLRA